MNAVAQLVDPFLPLSPPISPPSQVDAVALNSWIDACARCGQLTQALQAFQEAKRSPLLNATIDKVSWFVGREGQAAHPRATCTGPVLAL